jgi:hypothetical protein
MIRTRGASPGRFSTISNNPALASFLSVRRLLSQEYPGPASALLLTVIVASPDLRVRHRR